MNNTERTLRNLESTITELDRSLRLAMNATSHIHNDNQWPRENTLDNKHIAAVQACLQDAEERLDAAKRYITEARLKNVLEGNNYAAPIGAEPIEDELALTDGLYQGVDF